MLGRGNHLAIRKPQAFVLNFFLIYQNWEDWSHLKFEKLILLYIGLEMSLIILLYIGLELSPIILLNMFVSLFCSLNSLFQYIYIYIYSKMDQKFIFIWLISTTGLIVNHKELAYSITVDRGLHYWHKLKLFPYVLNFWHRHVKTTKSNNLLLKTRNL